MFFDIGLFSQTSYNNELYVTKMGDGGIVLYIFILRHGETEADLLDVHEGRADYPLTTKGHFQASKMAKYFSIRYQPDVIISSPMTRTRQTTEHILKFCNAKLEFDERLMEWNNGLLAGMDRTEAMEKFPLPPNGRPITEAIEEGESELAFRHRVEEAIFEILEKYKNCHQILIVSHGGSISHILNILLNHSINERILFPTSDLGLHCIEIKNEKKIVHFINLTSIDS